MNWYCTTEKSSIIDDRRGETTSYAMVVLLLSLYDGEGLTEMDKDLVTQIIYHVQV